MQGIDPASAVERLKRFKEEYRIRERKNNLYQARDVVVCASSLSAQCPNPNTPLNISTPKPQVGEEIFGLPVTEYPDLHATERELKLLDQLYGLYTEVLDTIRVRALLVCICMDETKPTLAAAIDRLTYPCHPPPGLVAHGVGQRDGAPPPRDGREDGGTF